MQYVDDGLTFREDFRTFPVRLRPELDLISELE
jgi:hypothetical protein